ncbi:MAG: amidophosphoribosyltransferase [Proteobacteria bacterium]|nr:MAG: amidophosphoribosyltransferase [Pseudomonadota bacterium]
MCGVVGIIGPEEAAKEVFLGLFTLQHRGQDAAGILSYSDGEGPGFHLYKENGLVEAVFNEEIVNRLPGRMAVGHTRYSTVGRSDNTRDIQPLVLNYPYGIGMAHNGNLVNYYELVEKLRRERSRMPLTNNDLEVLENLFADALLEQGAGNEKKLRFDQIQNAVNKVMHEATGGYSVVAMVAGQGMFAFRDPKGIRPLILGRRETMVKDATGALVKKDAYCVTSESILLSFLGYEIVGDLKAGELVFIDNDGNMERKVLPNAKVGTPCMFEWVYFAGAESVLEERPVYNARLALGKGLGRKVRPLIESGEMKPDIVVPVPETSRIAAIAMAEELNLPYREVLIKNRYIQRSFILNTPEKRAKAVDLKLNPVKSEIEGKNVLLVDDSIVRGTTSKRLVDLVRRAGAKEVYFVSTCSPIRHPCYYGVDFPSPEELIATGRDEPQIAQALNADKVIYLDQEAIREAIGLPSMCMACLDGKYPTDVSAGLAFREKRKGQRTL